MLTCMYAMPCAHVQVLLVTLEQSVDKYKYCLKKLASIDCTARLACASRQSM